MIFSKEQKRVLVKTITILLALFLIFICYSYVIPRTEVEIDTVYHSSYSALFVQSKINNAGTQDITDLKIKSSIWNGTEMLTTETNYPGILKAKQSVKLPNTISESSSSIVHLSPGGTLCATSSFILFLLKKLYLYYVCISKVYQNSKAYFHHLFYNIYSYVL